MHFASHFLSHLSPNKDTGSSKGTIHCDESSFERFHYSAVLWLTKQDSDTGGEIQFWEGLLREWRVTLQPEVGRTAIFTSGWEDIHRVTPLRVGQRWSLPLFASVYGLSIPHVCPKHACGQRVASSGSIARIVCSGSARPMKISIEKCGHKRLEKDIGTDGTDKLEVLQVKIASGDRISKFRLKLPICTCSNCDTKVWWEPSQAILVLR